ncbi:MAG: CHAD domain-containing protein [Kiritimatiellales bacterium]|nr:CHAD domain-containing protein [Kiritimatiellales bacterium]
MKLDREILKLGKRFEIESPHVEHVASQALEIFDGFFPDLGISKRDRELLSAAACLHDIGYASDSRNHVEEGARILLEHPLTAFSSNDWKTVVAIVLLHRRDWRKALNHELVAGFPEQRKSLALQLGAILRIADGLDHGHVQDAEIVSCRRQKAADRIDVRCGWYTGNIPWAQGKADLWQEVFGRPLEIRGTGKPADSPVMASVRKTLYAQYDIMRDNVPGMRLGEAPECLHDYRVAMRRFRAALKMFRACLRETSATELDARLGTLSDALGPVRDEQVWLQLIESGEVEALLRTAPGGAEYIGEERRRVGEVEKRVPGIIDSPACLETMDMMNRLLRVELPVRLRKESPKTVKREAACRLGRLLERLYRIDEATMQESEEQLHEIRKLCRRGRYYAEFATVVPGKDIPQLRRHLKAIATSLGQVRDVALHLQRIEGMPFYVPFPEYLLPLQRCGRERFSKHWKKIHKPAFRRKVMKQLNRNGKKSAKS